MKIIKFHEPYKAKNAMKYIQKVVEDNQYTDDYFKKAASELLTHKFGYENFLLTHSATAALEMTGILLRERKVKKINLPSYTFSSTANAFLRSGIDINFCDINFSDCTINLNSYTQSGSEYTCLVHYGNSSANIEECMEVLNYNFVEDAAQSFNAKFNNKLLGTFGDFGSISFHPTKNVHAGFGGMFISKNNEDLEMAKFIYERGTDRSKVISGLKNKYEWVIEGSSFEITELSAALLLAQLEEYENIYKIRKEVYNFYEIGLKNLVSSNKIFTQIINTALEPNYHAFYIILNEKRTEFLDFMKNNGVQCYIGYVPLHNSIYGSKLNLNKKLVVTENIADKIVRLPLHTELDTNDTEKIVNLINNYFS